MLLLACFNNYSLTTYLSIYLNISMIMTDQKQQVLSSSLYYVIDVTILCYRVTPTSLFKAFP